jgi:hypothetical protein
MTPHWTLLQQICVLWNQGLSGGHCAADGWVWTMAWVPLPL